MPSERNVFISSTSIDLKQYRERARQIAHRLHLRRIVMEDFDAGGPRPPLEECLRRVREDADLLVVVAARRYGWVPSVDWPLLPEDIHGKSITWLECLEARQKGIQIVPLLLEEDCSWPAEQHEKARSLELEQFKAWLKKHYVCKNFSSLESFEDELTRALDSWKNGGYESPSDPTAYLEWLRRYASRTLAIGTASVKLADVYVPLHGTGKGKSKPLDEFLDHRRLLLAGGPGSGKSTFLLRYAAELSDQRLKNPGGRFPLFIVAADLWSHVDGCARRHQPGSPPSLESPRWISHYLAAASIDLRWQLPGAFFEDLLEQGNSTLLVDGLDRAEVVPTAALISRTAHAYPRTRILVSSRPSALVDAVELDEFSLVDITPLDNRTMKALLLKWASLRNSQPDKAQQKARTLFEAIRESELCRRLGRNPLVLTAIVADQSVPVDLSSSGAQLHQCMLSRIVRETDAGSNVVDVLRELAWKMTAGPTYRTEVSQRWAVQQIEPFLEASGTGAAIKAMLRIAGSTGVLVVSEQRVRFGHSSLQEYLAADWLACRLPEDRFRILSAELKDRLVNDTWRDVLLFLAQILQDEPQDFEDLCNYLADQCTRAGDEDRRARYAASLAMLGREAGPLPQPARETLDAVLRSFSNSFASGEIREISLSARLELARAIGNEAIPAEISWIEIPGGEFWMGAQSQDPDAPRYDPLAHKSEGPVRRVRLKAYLMSRFPVTVEQYAAFVHDGGYRRPELWCASAFGKWTEPLGWAEQLTHRRLPVTGVSWHEATAFARWLGCRLPTEAEWERAAAGPDGRKYPWGDAEPNRSFANFDRKLGGITPVGLFPEYASAEGVNDLSGNVWEWVEDTFSDVGPLRVLRGGCFRNTAKFLRTSERIHAQPDQRYSNFGCTGFRCAKTLAI